MVVVPKESSIATPALFITDRIINDLIVGAKDEKWEELGRVMAEGIQDRLWGNTKGW
jgi:hypothetical protein